LQGNSKNCSCRLRFEFHHILIQSYGNNFFRDEEDVVAEIKILLPRHKMHGLTK